MLEIQNKPNHLLSLGPSYPKALCPGKLGFSRHSTQPHRLLKRWTAPNTTRPLAQDCLSGPPPMRQEWRYPKTYAPDRTLSGQLQFQPIPNHIDDNASFQTEDGVGYMFETYDDELKFVQYLQMEVVGMEWNGGNQFSFSFYVSVVVRSDRWRLLAWQSFATLWTKDTLWKN